MDEAIRRLRSEARELAHGRIPTAIRYPAAFRASAVALAQARLGRGLPFVRVARELGLPTQSLARWLQQSTPPVLRPVAVARAAEPVPPPPPAPGPSAVLITPQGVRVEGLDRDALIAVLRALG